MAIRLPDLTQGQLTTFDRLITEITLINANNRHRHIGENKGENLSQYKFSRWYDWTKKQRNDFKSGFLKKYVDKSLVGWVLHIPPRLGCIDKMTQWVGQSGAGTILAYALQDQQYILIDNKQHKLAVGQGIAFNVSEVHEIKRSESGQMWACLMLPDPLVKIND